MKLGTQQSRRLNIQWDRMNRATDASIRSAIKTNLENLEPEDVNDSEWTKGYINASGSKLRMGLMEALMMDVKNTVGRKGRQNGRFLARLEETQACHDKNRKFWDITERSYNACHVTDDARQEAGQSN